MYVLIASNEENSVINFVGFSIKEAIEKFDSQYYRSGWKIQIVNDLGNVIKTVKKTYK
jgi:hypothetical protein